MLPQRGLKCLQLRAWGAVKGPELAPAITQVDWVLPMGSLTSPLHKPKCQLVIRVCKQANTDIFIGLYQ
jgi:hypothetical protein